MNKKICQTPTVLDRQAVTERPIAQADLVSGSITD